MPAEILTDIEYLIPPLIGFWRFAFSPTYRAATIARWRSRSGARHLTTVGEILVPTFLGLVFPAAVVYFVFIRPRP